MDMSRIQMEQEFLLKIVKGTKHFSKQLDVFESKMNLKDNSKTYLFELKYIYLLRFDIIKEDKSYNF